MELVTGALPSVLANLSELLVGEYNLQQETKSGIRFLQAELESMKAALHKISGTPPDKLDEQDKVWARDVKELSYDIEDNIDEFMVRCQGRRDHLAKQQGFRKFIARSLDKLTQPNIRRKIAIEIRDIKSHVKEVSERRDRYKINTDAANSASTLASIDPRLLSQYVNVSDLIGIDEARDELIETLMGGREASNQIVSIVGFGGLGKTTLATVVYEKIREQFDSWAFISVSRTPDMKRLFKSMLLQLQPLKKQSASIHEEILDEQQLISELKQFLRMNRCLIVIDDIWDIWVWRLIRRALPDISGGYKIIATTRNLSVAEEVGGPYRLNPLCYNNSRRLLHRRIFGNEKSDNFFYEGLAEVSDKILSKCAGIPLAIITIASLLASKRRDKIEWYDVYNSVGTGLEDSLDINNMRKILSFSYYDLPSHLRSCLLYLSVFPEDFKVDKDRLVRLWLAEGFIQHKTRGHSLFEVGESYLNELINRSLIQLVYGENSSMLISCQVHDMVLDLIRSLSSEENFISYNGSHNTSPPKKIRRTSFQNGKLDYALMSATHSMEHVRSVVVFPSAFNIMPALSSLKVLRVLDLQGCSLPKGFDLKFLVNLPHLRYLGLRRTGIAQLPEEIGNLQFLETLDVRYNEIYSLPSSIIQLRSLLHLHLDEDTRVPNGIGSLTSLEELSVIPIESKDTVEELGHMTELRLLNIFCIVDWNETLDKSLVETISLLQKIQTVCIWVWHGQANLDAWVGPRHLRNLTLFNCWFSKLPSWINPSHLQYLSRLHLTLEELQEEDLKMLGTLLALRDLCLRTKTVKNFVVGAGWFPCLVYCHLWGFLTPLVFQEGAMPRLKWLSIEFCVRIVKEMADSNGGLDLGLGNLPFLQEFGVHFDCEGACHGEVDDAKALLKHVTQVHPNRPRLTCFWR